MKNTSEIQLLRQNLHDLQETIEDLHLYFVYQRFDLEATQRENVILRKLLKEKE